LHSVDTQHGRFEKCDFKGRHQGEVNMNLEPKKPADKSGEHNLTVK
jgi:filamentous hemagglutinin